MEVDLTRIKKIARSYYFSKTDDVNKKNDILSDLWYAVHIPVMRVVKSLENLASDEIAQLPWNIKRLADQLKESAHDYLGDVCKFINNGVIEPTKRLSFHLKELACFNKNKADKRLRFGRAFQLGRIGGNFLLVGKSDSVQMPDKKAVKSMLKLHQDLFPKTPSPSVALDKGYYTKANAAYLKKKTGIDMGLQKPSKVKAEKHSKDYTELIKRRNGIEPLIGHAKRGGQLGKSRMKYDRTIESSGYSAILGFNGRQLIRYLTGQVPNAA